MPQCRDGLIANIQRFSLDDGPGIRTTAFFMGCPLSCLWCHNPECIPRAPQIAFYRDRCALCGACAEACAAGVHVFLNGAHTLERDRCARCGACAQTCVCAALEWIGQTYSPEQLAKRLLLDRACFESSGGGVTLSGGEPLLQAQFARETAALLNAQGVRVAVDTCGDVPFSVFEDIAPFTDLFLYDLKACDGALHKRLTGRDNERIKENFLALQKSGARLFVRVPLVAGLNDDWEEMKRLAAFLRDSGGVERVELLAYHALGEGKYVTLGRAYAGRDFKPPTQARMQALADAFSDCAERVVIKTQ